MSEPNLDFTLRAALRAENKAANRIANGTCPTDSMLADYVSEAISDKAEKEIISSHVARCDMCFDKVASCVSGLSAPEEDNRSHINNSIIRRVLAMPKKYPRERTKASYIKRNKYLLTSALFFMLSFIFRLFFLQFLVAALIFGLKWIMDTGSTKALIMIYETWKHTKTTDADQDSKDKITKRRI